MTRFLSPAQADAAVGRRNPVPWLQKLNDFLAQTWPGLIRSKGHFWLAKRSDLVGELSLGRAVCRVEATGFDGLTYRVPVGRAG